jgi:hypothetical protein
VEKYAAKNSFLPASPHWPYNLESKFPRSLKLNCGYCGIPRRPAVFEKRCLPPATKAVDKGVRAHVLRLQNDRMLLIHVAKARWHPSAPHARRIQAATLACTMLSKPARSAQWRTTLPRAPGMVRLDLKSPSPDAPSSDLLSKCLAPPPALRFEAFSG